MIKNLIFLHEFFGHHILYGFVEDIRSIITGTSESLPSPFKDLHIQLHFHCFRSQTINATFFLKHSHS